MLDVVYEGSVGKVKCGTCSCWLGFEPADRLITAQCPTCDTPLVVPPQVLSFPDVKKPSTANLELNKREVAPLPAFPERNTKPSKDAVIRLDKEAPPLDEEGYVCSDWQVTPKGQITLPITRPLPTAVEKMSKLDLTVPPERQGQTPQKKPSQRRTSFNPRLQSAPNDGLNEGVTGDIRKGLVGSLQSMAGFLSVLATVMIIGVLMIAFFKKEEPSSTEVIEIKAPVETVYTAEELEGRGVAINP